jgi:transposase
VHLTAAGGVPNPVEIKTKVLKKSVRFRRMSKLENVSADSLRAAWASVDDSEAARRLAPAIAYKEVDGLSQTGAAATFGYSSAWASLWFDRLERLADEPVGDVVLDEPRSGRPPKLSSRQRDRFEAAVRQPPSEAGFDAPAWTVSLARRYLVEEFDVEYSHRHVRRLLSEARPDTPAARPADDPPDSPQR